ncbi:MAG: flagellar hook-associated protein FlgL [Chitinispirillales bacterium]|jgi:flagellin-like hook-associated protein FlgL|nr:flagellar hook-associated protein FlgL [Chitinispirillales bacterium]
MRVTFATVNRNVQKNLSGRYSDMVNLQEQLATGKRLRKPSDDPIDVANTIKLNSKQSQLKQYKRNMEDGLAIMGVTSSAMSSMNDILHRMKELSIKASNDTYSPSDRQSDQKEVDELFRQMMAIINTQYNGNYIFNGTQTKTAPYNIESSGTNIRDYGISYLDPKSNTYKVEWDPRANPMSYYSLTSELNTQNWVNVTPHGYPPGGPDYGPQYTPSIDIPTGAVNIGDTFSIKLDYTGTLPLPAGGESTINVSNIYNAIPTISFDIDGDGTIGAGETYEIDKDYRINYTTGELTIISERMSNNLSGLNGTAHIENIVPFEFIPPRSGSNVPDILNSTQLADSTIKVDVRNSDIFKIGDTMQMKWDHDSSELKNILTLTALTSIDLVIKSPRLDDDKNQIYDADGYPEYDYETVTLQKRNPNNPLNPQNPDYDINPVTGEITILSEKMRDALNNAPKDSTFTFNRDNSENFNFCTSQGPVTVQLLDAKSGTQQTSVQNIFPGSLKITIGSKTYTEGFGEWKPGYYDENGTYHKGENEYDYKVNYETGEITFYNTDLMKDVTPEWLWVNQYNTDPYAPNTYHGNYSPNKFQISFDYITKSKDIYGNEIKGDGKISRAIEEGISTSINMTAQEMLNDPYSGNNMVDVFLNFSQALHTGDREAIQESIDKISTMYDAVLNAQSEIGARINRYELTLKRNDEQAIEVSAQKSALEDADLAEVITKLMLTENVYQAALQAAMRVLQPSLANFM